MSENREVKIPDEAVEAAREAARAAMIELGPDWHMDGDEEITRAALEAAAPHLMAPRIVATVEELNALPAGSVVLNRHGDSAQKDQYGDWWFWGGDVPLVAEEVGIPATVLHGPEAPSAGVGE